MPEGSHVRIHNVYIYIHTLIYCIYIYIKRLHDNPRYPRDAEKHPKDAKEINEGSLFSLLAITNSLQIGDNLASKAQGCHCTSNSCAVTDWVERGAWNAGRATV